MTARLEVEIEPGVLESAELQAKSQKTNLSEFLARQLRVMAENWDDSQAGRTPITDGLRGAVKLPATFDEAKVLTEELQRNAG